MTHGRMAAPDETHRPDKCSKYTVVEDPLTKNKLFRCDICERKMASKQNVFKHLVSAHNFSPMKKIKKKYLEDSSVPIPRRTANRWKMKAKLLSNGPENSNQSTELSTLAGECSELMDTAEPIQDELTVYPDIENDERCLSGKSSENEDSETDQDSTVDTSQSSSDSSDFSLSDAEDEYQKPESNQESPSLAVLSCILRNNLSVSTSKDIIQTMKSAYPSCAGLNSLEYEDLWKHVASNNVIEFHYCSVCDHVFTEDLDQFQCTTLNCDGLRYKGGLNTQRKNGRQPVASFMIADTQQQLKSLIESPGIWKDIKRNKKHQDLNDFTIKDLTSGLEYRKLMTGGHFLYGAENSNVTAIFNTDGINLYSSSKVELWPIFLAINELSPEKRFARENMILAGIWQGKGKPPFYQYLNAFSKDMNNLYENGVYSEKLEVNVRLAVICATVDLPAKCGIMNMTLFNGTEACVTCEEPGKVVKQGKGHSRCYPFREADKKYPIRSSTGVRESMQNASESRRNKGFKGESGLLHLSSMPLPVGIVPDYMHGVLLGITKTLMYKWFSSTESRQEYFIGNHLKEISKRLSCINPPDFIERLPRNLEKSYTHFKATEYQSWLLFYGLPCVSGILPRKYLDHFALLSESVYILLGDYILPSDMLKAERMLTLFYQQFTQLYPEGSCGLNVHNAGAHLVYFVQHWGPLWAWSCFAFEDSNAMILQAVHGTGNVMKQVLRFKQAQSLLRCMNPERVTGNKKWKVLKNAANCDIAGALKPLHSDHFEDLIKEVLHVDNFTDVKKVSRIVMSNGQRFYSEIYHRMKRRACNIVLLTDGRIAAVKYFLLSLESKNVYAAIVPFLQSEESGIQDLAAGKHLIPVVSTGERQIVPVDNLRDNLFFINTKAENSANTVYVSRAPNCHGRSVFK